jgi:hypothetical protein
VRTTRFWNNHHQVHSKSKDWKTKQISGHDVLLESPLPGKPQSQKNGKQNKLVCTTRFWNHLQVRSNSKDWKTKYISAHDPILESPSLGTLKVERLEIEITLKTFELLYLYFTLNYRTKNISFSYHIYFSNNV